MVPRPSMDALLPHEVQSNLPPAGRGGSSGVSWSDCRGRIAGRMRLTPSNSSYTRLLLAKLVPFVSRTSMQITYWSHEDGTYVSNDVTAEEAKRFVNVATCPKCGTNFLVKIFREFGINYKYLGPRKPHLFHHVKFRPTKRRNYADLDKRIKRDEIYVGAVRDPRDFFVSYINWINKINGQLGREANDAWQSESFET